ncbi:ATP-binding SpoIIE family protein phosphatase [Streptomyces aidingensis]|uniref:Serine phosphatase RsbU, regulator of sigma subunit n=1 Tax=Streptomyces aidingensis TaxID=910347 RepID=A0A1I1QXR6_9ACTN|nr:SpoIIE family protein phosphatase [Streptomyces aidingensis]SFD26782.1 Serine phosphatase RsbU, regulator of sigma subunit [Streptomyces aidingensis]
MSHHSRPSPADRNGTAEPAAPAEPGEPEDAGEPAKPERRPGPMPPSALSPATHPDGAAGPPRPHEQQRLDLLHAAALRIGNSLDVTGNAEEMVGVLVPTFADLGVVDITEPVLAGEEPGDLLPGTPMRRVAVAAADGPWPPEMHPLGATILLGEQAREHIRRGSAGVMSDLTKLRRALRDDPEQSRTMLPPGAASFLVLPLQARGAVLGAVALWRCGDRPAFEQRDATLAEEIGSRLALSMDNARRYTRERRTAEALQRSLLPRPIVNITAAETSGVYAPASTAAGIGGSWYDVIALSSTRVAFVVGRVAGHGVNAAGATGRLRSAVQTLADLDPAPDELLTHLDDLVVRFSENEQRPEAGRGAGAGTGTGTRTGRGRGSGTGGAPAAGNAAPPDPPADSSTLLGATLLYATYDPVSRQCLIASAGHPSPVLTRRADGTPQSVDLVPGPPLGVGGEPFEPLELRLDPGDVLAFHSGSATPEPDLDALRTGARAAAADGAGPLAGVGRRVLADLQHQPRLDDLALLLARVQEVPEGSTAAWELPADPSLVADIRSLVSARLTDWGLAELAFATELIVSELVTNAIRYAGGPVGIRLIRDQRLICEVSDPSQTQPHLRRARLSDEGGRGLFLVAQLAHRWGSRYTPTGKTIWTEQSLEPLRAAGRP